MNHNEFNAVRDIIVKTQSSVDNNKENIEKTQSDLGDVQDALCEQSIIQDQSISEIENSMSQLELSNNERLSIIEDALCELSLQQERGVN